MTEFFDALSALCAREMSAATKAADYDRSAAVIEGLATMLGRHEEAGSETGAAVEGMLADYHVMRQQARVCRGS